MKRRVQHWRGHHGSRLEHLTGRLRESWWAVPAVCIAGAIGLSELSDWIAPMLNGDRSMFLFDGGPEGAREVLSIIAGSMMQFTALVFSVTILVLQLASSQFSPRVLRTFLKDTPSQVALGTFVGTFVFALLSMRQIRAFAGESASAPTSLSVWIAIMLAFCSVGAFVYYIHHIAQSIRAVVLIRRIANDTRRAMVHIYPDGIGCEVEAPRNLRPPGLPTVVIPFRGVSGVLVRVDQQVLLRHACKRNLVLKLIPMMGDFVGYGCPLFEVWGDPERVDAKALIAAVSVSGERTLHQDPLFGIRELVDIAERALSPALNDPTTAVQALDQIHDLLRRLAGRRFPAMERVDEDDHLRLILPRPDFDTYVRLATDEIRQSGAQYMQVTRRLRLMLEDLQQLAPADRCGEIEHQLGMLDSAVEKNFPDVRERRVAMQPSPQGHGPV